MVIESCETYRLIVSEIDEVTCRDGRVIAIGEDERLIANASGVIVISNPSRNTLPC